jgi:hypothetical protein
MAKIVYEKRDTVKFKRRGRVLTGKVAGKWAPGEGDGYCVEVDGDFVDVQAKNIVGLV